MKLVDVRIGKRYFYKFRRDSEGCWSFAYICLVLSKKRRVKIKHLSGNHLNKITWVTSKNLSGKR